MRTILPSTASTEDSVPAGSEFCDAKLGRRIFGFPRAHRLWCCQSIRDFLRANMEEAK